MCANCVTKADAIAATIGFGMYVFKGPAQDGLVALGLLPEPHPLAVEMRTVSFLRDLDLDPEEILGTETVEAADRALAFPRQKVYRRSFREAVAFFTGWGLGSMRSQTVLATK